MNTINNYKGAEGNKKRYRWYWDRWQQQETMTTLQWHEQRDQVILSDFRVKNYSTKTGILQELVWQELGLWMRRVWWKLESWRRCSLFKERKDHSDFSSPALHYCTFNHLTYPEANWKGACVTYFQNTRILGNEREQCHILALLIFPALALPLLSP